MTLRTNAGITLLVNNTGIPATAPLLDSDVEKIDEMIRLNVGALARLTYAAAPGFVAGGNGTIVNMDSSLAISPETLNGVYGGTKAFVLALSRLARSNTNSQARACEFRWSCRERRRRVYPVDPDGNVAGNRWW
jgi:short-subunit dehydrogenase